MEFEKEEWFCKHCNNTEFYTCDCGNKICTNCGCVHKGPYPLPYILAPIEI